MSSQHQSAKLCVMRTLPLKRPCQISAHPPFFHGSIAACSNNSPPPSLGWLYLSKQAGASMVKYGICIFLRDVLLKVACMCKIIFLQVHMAVVSMTWLSSNSVVSCMVIKYPVIILKYPIQLVISWSKAKSLTIQGQINFTTSHNLQACYIWLQSQAFLHTVQYANIIKYTVNEVTSHLCTCMASCIWHMYYCGMRMQGAIGVYMQVLASCPLSDCIAPYSLFAKLIISLLLLNYLGQSMPPD